jgi:hypothetical protein
MKYFFKLALLLLLSGTAQAFIPSSGISSYTTYIYGAYSTSDPYCKTGWITFIPFSSSPVAYDLKQVPTLASNTLIASPVNCVMVIMANKVTISTNTSFTSTSFSQSDSVCSNLTSSTIASTTSTSTAITWPAAGTLPYINMSGASLSMISTSTGATTDILPVYFSTLSSCTGNPNTGTSDSTVCYTPTYVNGYKPPVASGDTTYGYKLSALGESSRYKLLINPDLVIGGNGVSCTNMYAPQFGVTTY